jgi:hypothetical protein
MLCTMSLIDLIVPFLSSISVSIYGKDCIAGHVEHLEVTTNEELASHDCECYEKKVLSVYLLKEGSIDLVLCGVVC